MYFRMTPECYDEVLALIENEIRKMPTHFRIPISPSERLAICLRYNSIQYKEIQNITLGSIIILYNILYNF